MAIISKPLAEGLPQGRIFYDPDVKTDPSKFANPCGVVVSSQATVSHFVIPPNSAQARKFETLFQTHPSAAKTIVPMKVGEKTYYLQPSRNNKPLSEFLQEWCNTPASMILPPENETLERLREIQTAIPDIELQRNIMAEVEKRIELGEISAEKRLQAFAEALGAHQQEQIRALRKEATLPIYLQLPEELLPALSKYHKEIAPPKSTSSHLTPPP